MKNQAKPDHPSHETLSLPDLQNAWIDNETAEKLFDDIAACAEVLEVIPRLATGHYALPGFMSLEAGRHLFFSGQAGGLQIRYRHAGSEWWDTLMHREDKIRVVRIEHRF